MHKRKTIKLHVQIFLKMNTWMFEICRSQYNCFGGRDSSVGIATRYVSDDPRIESRWQLHFPHTSRPALEVHTASYTMGTGPFLGVKQPERGVDHLLTSSAEIEGRVELYTCSSSGPSGLRGLLLGEIYFTLL
jgi:hypothetical protein